MNKNNSEIGKNSITYSNELVWLNELIEARFKQHFSNELIEKNTLLIMISNQSTKSRQASQAARYSQAYESWLADVEERQRQEKRNSA